MPVAARVMEFRSKISISNAKFAQRSFHVDGNNNG
jgi:hypothetical protein